VFVVNAAVVGVVLHAVDYVLMLMVGVVEKRKKTTRSVHIDGGLL